MFSHTAQKISLFFCAFFVSSTYPATADTAAAGNSCVECHRSTAGVSYLKHDFADWEHSVHANAGVRCEACHGGNPAAPDKAQAHTGLKPSTDPASPVYFNRIPATCGECHQAEYKAFQKSAHFKELERSGRGPNCVTCHGSMANHILSPRDLETSCSLCHQKPTQAAATMLSLQQAASSVKRLEVALAQAKNRHVSVAPQEQTYRELALLEEHARQDWHTFKMADVLKTSHEIAQRATNAVNEVHLKEQQQKP